MLALLPTFATGVIGEKGSSRRYGAAKYPAAIIKAQITANFRRTKTRRKVSMFGTFDYRGRTATRLSAEPSVKLGAGLPGRGRADQYSRQSGVALTVAAPNLEQMNRHRAADEGRDGIDSAVIIRRYKTALTQPTHFTHDHPKQAHGVGKMVGNGLGCRL